MRVFTRLPPPPLGGRSHQSIPSGKAVAPMRAIRESSQRAIWFRFAPIRASSRVRSRSTSAAGAVQVRTRPTDRCTRSDSVNPAERALACHLRLAGADLHPHVASSAHDVPLPLGGSEGAQPPASPCRGPAKRGPKG